MLKRTMLIVLCLSLTGIAQQPYQLLVVARTGDVIAGNRIVQIGPSNDDFVAVRITGRDDAVFYAVTDRGVAGLFTPARAIVVEGQEVDRVTVARILDFRTGISGVVWSAIYSRADCPGCKFKGVFREKTRVLELPENADIVDLALTEQGEALTIARLKAPAMDALYRNDRVALKTGDVVAGVTLRLFGRGLIVGGDGITTAAPVAFTAPGKPNGGGVLIGNTLFENVTEMVGVGTTRKPITQTISTALKDVRESHPAQLVLDGKPFFTGRYNMEADVLSERTWVVKSLPVNSLSNQPVITSSYGLAVDGGSFGAVAGLGQCCLLKGRPSIDWQGGVAFQVVSLDKPQSAVVVATMDRTLEPTLKMLNPSAGSRVEGTAPAPGAAKAPEPSKAEKAVDIATKVLRGLRR